MLDDSPSDVPVRGGKHRVNRPRGGTPGLLQEHPGFTAKEALDDIQTTLEIFLDGVNDLVAAISAFRNESNQRGFFGRGNQWRVEDLERPIRKSFFTVTSAAFALVDTTRRVQRDYKVPGYQQRVDESFANNELHKFIQDLRNVFTHKHLLNPGWQKIYSAREKLTRFVLDKKVLERYNEWCPLSRSFMAKHSFGVDIERLTADYRTLVESFHNWFRDSIMATVGSEIEEYLSYEKILKGQNWKVYWRNILNAGIQGQLNPYDYLHEHLAPAEIERAQALPARSRDQVDLFISVADDFEICDDEIRGLVYKLFRIS